MYCKYCGREIEDQDQFCPYCGKEQIEPISARISDTGRKWTDLKVPSDTKNPGVAASLGFFLGWFFLGPIGYVYLEQWNWFWLTFIIQLFAVPLTFGIAWIIIPVLLAFHQYQQAQQINKLVMASREKGLDEEEIAEPGEQE